MMKIALEDFLNYRFLSRVQFSSQGKVALSCARQNKMKNQYDSVLMKGDPETEHVFQVTSFNKEKDFIWDSEDSLLFPSVRDKQDEAEKYWEKTVFYRISTVGGEATQAFEVPYKVTAFKKISEQSGYALTLLQDLNRLDLRKASIEELKDNEDYLVLEEVPFWANGEGYVSRLRQSLAIADGKGKCEVITTPYFHVRNFKVNAAGTKILYSGLEFQHALKLESGLYLYDVKTKQTEILIKQGQLCISEFDFMKDEIIFTATDMKKWGMGQNKSFYSYNVDKKTYELICPYDFSIGSIISTDCRYGGGIVFKAWKDSIYFCSIQGTRCEVYQLQDKQIYKCFDFDGSVDCFDINDKYIVFVGSICNQLPEVYCFDRTLHQIKQWTSLNQEALLEKEISLPKECSFTNRDGIKIDGWVMKPIEFDSNLTYPGILSIHGGPRVAFGHCFFHEMQMLAAQGYFVFFCNPRGSDGKGDAFADIRGQYGQIDYHDLMDLTDHVLQQYPQLDPARLGVMGGSYGGFMTNWIIGSTPRFAAAVSQRSVSNWISDFGTSEIGFSFDLNEVQATPWTDVLKMWDQSPLKNANQVETPTLFIHSLEDYNCPISQGLEMFTALKIREIESRFCVFKGENHELSRSGKPRHRIRRLNEILNWFNHYLK